MKLIRLLCLLCLMPLSMFSQSLSSRIDVIYTVKDNWQGRLDLYLPDTKENNALVIYIHGGGWTHGRKEAEYEKFKVFIENGYAVANVEYRLANQAPAPAAIEDVQCAIAYLLKNADSLKLDKRRFVLMGGSAGAHLALLAGLGASQMQGSCSLRQFKPAAIISKYGPTDLLRWKPAMTEGGASASWLADKRKDTAFVNTLSPISYVSKDHIPVLFVHGDQDKTVPMLQSETLYRKLKKHGYPAQMYVVQGGKHGNFGEVETPKMDAVMIAFLRKYLKR